MGTALANELSAGTQGFLANGQKQADQAAQMAVARIQNPSLGGQQFLNLLPTQLQQLYNPDQVSAIKGIQSIPQSTADTLVNQLMQLATQDHPTLVSTTPQMQSALGLGPQIPLNDFQKAQQAAQSQAQYDYPAELVTKIPQLEGKKGSLDDLDKAAKLEQDLLSLGASESDLSRKAADTASFIAKQQGGFVDPKNLQAFLQKNYPDQQFFIPAPIEVGDYKGKIDFNQFLDQNQKLQDIASTATDIGLTTTKIRGTELDNQLKGLQVNTFNQEFQTQMDHLNAQTQEILTGIDRTKALLPGEIQQQGATLQATQAGTAQTIQNTQQSAKLFPLTVDKLEIQNRLSTDQADKLEQTLDATLAQMKADLDQTLANTEGINLKNAAQEITNKYLTQEKEAEIKGQLIQNGLTQAQADKITTELHDLLPQQIEKLKSETALNKQALTLNQQKASQATQLFQAQLEQTKTDTAKMQQELEQGKTMFSLELDKEQATIDDLLAKGKIDRAQADYLEQTAKVRSGLLDLQFKRGQAEMQEFPLNIMWNYLGLQDAPPPGFKVYNFQLDSMINLLKQKKGTAIKAGDLFAAAGVDTENIPDSVKNTYVNVDGAGELANALHDLKTTEYQPIQTYVQLATALIEAYSPQQPSDLFETIYLQNHPEMAKDTLAPKMDKLPKDVKTLVQDLFDKASAEQGVQFPGSIPGVNGVDMNTAEVNIVSDAAHQAINRAGNVDKALQIAESPEARASATQLPGSPFYQNDALYNQYVNFLKGMAGQGPAYTGGGQ